VAQSLVSAFAQEVKSGTSNSLPFATTYILYVVFGEPLSLEKLHVISKEKQAAVAQRRKHRNHVLPLSCMKQYTKDSRRCAYIGPISSAMPPPLRSHRSLERKMHTLLESLTLSQRWRMTNGKFEWWTNLHMKK
jgi:hypothetical protein